MNIDKKIKELECELNILRNLKKEEEKQYDHKIFNSELELYQIIFKKNFYIPYCCCCIDPVGIRNIKEIKNNLDDIYHGIHRYNDWSSVDLIKDWSNISKGTSDYWLLISEVNE